MKGLFQLIVYILLIYFTYKWVVKPLFRILLQYMLKKVINDQFGQFKNNKDQGNYRNGSKPEGSINIDYIPEKDTNKAPKKNTEGEYVDYEEVK